jgi:hypothetical protein
LSLSNYSGGQVTSPPPKGVSFFLFFSFFFFIVPRGGHNFKPKPQALVQKLWVGQEFQEFGAACRPKLRNSWATRGHPSERIWPLRLKSSKMLIFEPDMLVAPVRLRSCYHIFVDNGAKGPVVAKMWQRDLILTAALTKKEGFVFKF